LIRQSIGDRRRGVTKQTYPARQLVSGFPESSMRVSQAIAVHSAARSLIALLTGLAFLACFGAAEILAADSVRQPTAIQFSFDRPIDASAAPFVLAAADGLFGSEGLAVTTHIANGSPDAIARVAAGTIDLALVDINALIRFRDRSDAQPVKTVFVLFNKSSYAVIARKSRGIHALSDIEGKTLGVAEGDLSIRLWPALARQNGIKIASVKQEHFGAAVREPMLSAGQVDAVSGFSYLSAVNLRDRGVPADDLAVFRYADYGCEAYGFAVIVNPAFAAARPEAVKGFLRAVVAGAHLAIQQPKRAVDEVVSRMDGGSPELELERLRTVIHDNILTGEVQRDGIGGIDPARLERSIDQISEGFKFRKRPSAADIFDESFLPPLGGRLIN
jgi:NitT/TauT family transport system substrate-binding protein